ncbi:MAG: hypothetical protein H7A22_02070 [Spirochaetales bacterium]|nr:hypothetical protein [Spirochaetales bacterium]
MKTKKAQPPDPWKDVIATEERLLLRNWDLIRSRGDEILSRPDWYFVRSASFYFLMAYISGSGPLTLGEMTLLWQTEDGRGRCPHCQGVVFLFRAGGSPLTGNHWIHGICPSCRSHVEWMRPTPFALNVAAPIMRAKSQSEKFAARFRCSGSSDLDLYDVILAMGGRVPLVDRIRRSWPTVPQDTRGGMILGGEHFELDIEL